ncbi:MAG: YggS family pyridoxal phosphate-dependent enzyme [Deltaproteobacteria bacterium]|nr:YggS family pyridoxal phosphate-dependent enzyme [Deltaproteobacteria bacterium]
MSHIEENLIYVGEKIAKAAERSGRNTDEVHLVAVSKTFDAGYVKEAVKAGQSLFGENRVQEARDKVPLVDEGAQWHMIGRLQKNKAKYIPGLFDMVHSVDSLELAQSLNDAMEKALERGKELKSDLLPVLVQVNIAEEEQKGGTKESETADLVKKISFLPRLKVKGLMIIPPFSDNPENSRPYYKKLKEMRDSIDAMNIPNVEMTHLSMGMSGDYEVAVEEGATFVRVGSAIFGKRDYLE